MSLDSPSPETPPEPESSTHTSHAMPIVERYRAEIVATLRAEPTAGRMHDIILIESTEDKGIGLITHGEPIIPESRRHLPREEAMWMMDFGIVDTIDMSGSMVPLGLYSLILRNKNTDTWSVYDISTGKRAAIRLIFNLGTSESPIRVTEDIYTLRDRAVRWDEERGLFPIIAVTPVFAMPVAPIAH